MEPKIVAKQDKLTEKLLRKPTPSDVKWREWRGYLLSLGFEEIQKDGSRVRFILYEVPDGGEPVKLFFHVPHPSPEVKPRYIRQATETLKERGLL